MSGVSGTGQVTRTTCPYCGVGCGVAVTREAEAFRVEGDRQHPANFGRLCSKGAALGETLSLAPRLLHPQLRGQRVDWATALDAVTGAFARAIAEYGPDSVAFYVSGQLLTEDYYVANKLMKGFIGSANIDTNSRLCMASAVAGHRRAFGADAVPVCYEDLEEADLVVLTGSNLAWCHPVLFQRLRDARERRPQMKVIVLDPRRTDTCELADRHLALAPGSDVALWNGLLRHLVDYGAVDFAFLERHASGWADAIAAAREAGSVPEVAAACGLSEDEVLGFYQAFTGTPRVVTAFSQGVNQSSSGTDKVNAILNAHLLTGRIGRPGAGPFSVTGQPNAMGGREVGGLANQLAAHMDFEPDAIDRVRRFWRAPNVATRPGLKAVELFDAVHRGRIRALWIMGTNPAVSLPDADRVREALARCEFVAVSDCVRDTDTAAYADALLPALAWSEKDGTVTNSERRISRQRAFRPAPGEARPDWWAVCEVARRLGYGDAFAYGSPSAIFDEHARLSAFENGGARAFDIGALAGMDRASYDALEPVRWPLPAPAAARCADDGSMPDRDVSAGAEAAAPAPATGQPALHAGGTHRARRCDDRNRSAGPADGPNGTDAGRAQRRTPVREAGASGEEGGAPRLFADGRFWHPDGRARLLPLSPRPPANAPDERYPLVLNTGRVRDHWHTMTRTGHSPRLSAHVLEPTLEVHTDDARALGLADGALARLHSRWGEAVLRVKLSDAQRRGSVFAPMHWNAQFASAGRVDAVVNPATDPVSGEPEFKHTPVAAEPVPVNWYGFALSREPLELPPSLRYWVRATAGTQCTRYELAGDGDADARADLARALVGGEGDWLELADSARGGYRAARLVEGRLLACVFIATGPGALPERDWLVRLFGDRSVTAHERAALLSGRAPGGRGATGRTVCSCFGTGEATIVAAVREGAGDPAAVTRACKAGGNCGSCVTEIAALIRANRLAEAG